MKKLMLVALCLLSLTGCASEYIIATNDGKMITASEKPVLTAKKEVLVAWVAENVAKEDGSDYTVDELNELTKPQLQEIIDSVE